MANRLSFVIARKKIMSMYRVNEKKDAIIQSIFQKLGTWEGVKTKEIFNRVIPELADIINIQNISADNPIPKPIPCQSNISPIHCVRFIVHHLTAVAPHRDS